MSDDLIEDLLSMLQTPQIVIASLSTVVYENSLVWFCNSEKCWHVTTNDDRKKHPTLAFGRVITEGVVNRGDKAEIRIEQRGNGNGF